MINYSVFTRPVMTIATIGIGILTVACENKTTRPLCVRENMLSSLPGASGNYTISLQDDEYDVNVTEFAIKQLDGSLQLALNGDETKVQLCSWQNGWTVSQSKDKETGLYSYSRVTVTNIGYLSQPIFFDRAALTASNIPSKIVTSESFGLLSNFPLTAPQVRANLGETLKDMLIIDNSGINWRLVTKAAHSAPGGFFLVRQ